MNPKALAAALLLAACTLSAQGMPPGNPPAPTAPLKGEVLEAKDVEIYTYMRLKTAEGETWAAVPKATVKKGAKVTIENPMVMENFESKSLNKKFDRIVFGSLMGAAPAAAAAPAAPMGAPHGNAAKPVGDVKVAKATGPDAKTVAEVIGGKASLKGKSVLVQGKVVKFNAGILGKNWIHLQDGSGKAADGSNDLLVTTAETAAVGEVLLVSGKVRTDADFGSGYTYAVLVEDAKLRK